MNLPNYRFTSLYFVPDYDERLSNTLMKTLIHSDYRLPSLTSMLIRTIKSQNILDIACLVLSEPIIIDHDPTVKLLNTQFSDLL